MGHATSVALLFLAASACGGSARLPVSDGTGPRPVLPAPRTSLIPTVNVARAVGWSNSATPIAAPGLEVHAFATALGHPRWLYVLPNGDVLVAETNAPVRPEDGRGIRGWFMRRFMKQAGAAVPSADRITLLRDSDGDGVADLRTVFAQGLHSPFGMALIDSTLYVANTDAVVRFRYRDGMTQLDGSGDELTRLPAGPINHHWTKSLIASPDAQHLYVGVGSNSNVAENGMANETGRAAIWEIDARTGTHRVFATGLRNPVGLAWEPGTGALWVSVNERDELGGDLVPDYMTSVRDGGHYGWPYSYFGSTVDTRVTPQRPDLVSAAIVPDYALGPHTASLGLASAQGNHLGESYREGMFVGQHGSWNRKPRSGYRVVFVPFIRGKPAGDPMDVLTGFLDAAGRAQGRPVGVAIGHRGGLLVADDVGNVIWAVTAR
ncbi:MAG: sorbosone dehydrogenase family protein [Gemmatimonadales bacterium]